MNVVSRSAIDTRLKCPTRRFWEYEWGGTGLSPEGVAMPLAGGIALHNMLAQALEAAWRRRPGGPAEGRYPPFEGVLDVIIADGLDAYREEVRAAGFLNQPNADTEWLLAEQSFLIEGLVRGWVRFRLPDILAHYDVVSIEREESVLQAEDWTQPLRLDVLLRAKSGGFLVVLDYKTHAYAREEWAAALRNSKQTHLYTPAVEKLYGEHCDGVQYEGLFKGARKKGSGRFADRKIQQSVLCYGYRGPADPKTGEVPWMTEYTGRKGWNKDAVWLHFTAKEWLEKHVSEADLKELFQTVPPTRPTPLAMEREVVSVARAERSWATRVAEGIRLSIVEPEAVPEWLGSEVEKNRDACLAYGADHRCPYWALCNDELQAQQPLESGFKPREDHHADEEKEAA